MAMALLLAGLANGFRSEVSSTVDGVGATHWIMASGAHGGLTAFAAFPESDAALVAHQPGVAASAPFLLVPGQSAILQHTSFSYNLAGVEPGHLGDPTVGAGDGHALSGQRQAVVDRGQKLPWVRWSNSVVRPLPWSELSMIERSWGANRSST